MGWDRLSPWGRGSAGGHLGRYLRRTLPLMGSLPHTPLPRGAGRGGEAPSSLKRIHTQEMIAVRHFVRGADWRRPARREGEDRGALVLGRKEGRGWPGRPGLAWQRVDPVP